MLSVDQNRNLVLQTLLENEFFTGESRCLQLAVNNASLSQVTPATRERLFIAAHRNNNVLMSDGFRRLENLVRNDLDAGKAQVVATAEAGYRLTKNQAQQYNFFNQIATTASGISGETDLRAYLYKYVPDMYLTEVEAFNNELAQQTTDDSARSMVALNTRLLRSLREINASDSPPSLKPLAPNDNDDSNDPCLCFIAREFRQYCEDVQPREFKDLEDFFRRLQQEDAVAYIYSPYNVD